MDNALLSAELVKPAYNGKTAAQCAADLNTLTVSVTRGPIPSRMVLRAIQFADLTALTADQKSLLQLIISAGEVDPSDNEVVNAFQSMFASKTATLSNLNALRTQNISIANSLGWGGMDNATLAQFITKVTGRV